MADSGQEKTEEPSARKLRKAREEGNVFQSRDIVTLAVLLATFITLNLTYKWIYRSVRSFMVWIIGLIGGKSLTLAPQIVTKFMSAAVCVLPIMIIAIVAGIVAVGVQTRFNRTMKPLRPHFNRLNPANGIKRVFSLRNLLEVLKSIIKIVILFFLLYSMISSDITPLARMMDMDLLSSGQSIMSLIFNLVMRVALAFGVIAFIDYMYQRWEYHKNMMMTKQEVKDEYKEEEGNPETKNRIRKAQREMSQRRMIQEVPKADVVVRNPTHVAVALRYDPDKMAAPIVVAKGLDSLALRIVSVAEANGVPWVENKPLARDLYDACDLGQAIPQEYFGAVAELLIYIYRQEGREDELLR